MSEKRVLAVTGGAGVLGYNVCNRLSGAYEKILILDIAPIDPKDYPKNAQYAKVDVRNRARVREALRGVDFVIHAAAALPLWRREEIFDININGTRNVLEAAKDNDVDRVVHISSAAVYGIPVKHPLCESDPLCGVGAYGKSKVEAERVCEEYRALGMCVPILRAKTFLGAGRLGLFHILYDWVESGKRIPMIGSGTNRYQLLEIDDLVAVIDIILAGSRDKVNDTFNVGAERFLTVREDLQNLCDFSGTGARVMCTPEKMTKTLLAFLKAVGLSPLYQWAYGTASRDSYLSIEKIKNLLGWSPKYSNAEALIRSYAWYREHKHELSEMTGISHRVKWRQGVLALAKRFL
jgi:nucleoside-diphosphate-sugar epimerase